uniref:ATP-binding cassette transporter n=1 Tax=Diaphorina citri TaxID=121845 RepID=A0A6G5VBL3_DIACI|nr:ATP-binding cassette transporter [Diaphorina citri]
MDSRKIRFTVTLPCGVIAHPPSEIRFESMSLTSQSIVNKEILHGISGEFKAGQLTAIMGPSGAGKSTLLNILAGLTLTGSSGKILVNGQERKSACIEQFLKLSCYIQQDDALRPKLTVTEAMMIASHLKLGFKVSTQEKKDQIFELLEMLGLENHCNTLCACLSGGQKKRLSVALELITNPPILFLDEPTTGLDSSSCSQCVSLLANLAKQGRTVVATIHTPSALLFEKFDSLYALAKGHCIYRGSISRLVPHLASLGLPCPAYHNPADFLMEVAIGEYGADTVTLAKAASAKCTPNNNEEEVVTSQFVPLELEILKREHFNRWYSLGPYIISNLGIEIPFQILCSFCYLGPSYLMTSQPLELFRFCYFILLGTMSSLVAQSTGFLFGATLPVTIAVFLGPVLMVLFSVFGFAIRFNDIPAFFLPIHYFSFIRATFQSLVFSLYGYGRDLLPCSAVYCHFRNPMTFLTEMEFVHIDVWSEVAYVVMLLCCVHLVTALVVWRRLNKR